MEPSDGTNETETDNPIQEGHEHDQDYDQDCYYGYGTEEYSVDYYDSASAPDGDYYGDNPDDQEQQEWDQQEGGYHGDPAGSQLDTVEEGEGEEDAGE